MLRVGSMFAGIGGICLGFKLAGANIIWANEIDRHSLDRKATYSLRSETIKRVFAYAKEKHAMRYTHLRGHDRVRNWVMFKFAAMNLKKMATWAAKSHGFFAVFDFCFWITQKPCSA